jgi:hypothetical protein
MSQQPDPEKQDFLEVDPDIPGQKYVCMSFISPDELIKQKETFFQEKFLDSYVAKLKIDCLEKFLVEQIPKLNEQFNTNITVQDVLPKLEEYVKENSLTFREENVQDEYQNYLLKNRETLEEKYHEQNQFQTTMRGLKIRGTYNTLNEAQVRAKMLQKRDPVHNVFVGQVGFWLPFNPSAESIEDQEYAEKELNDLMKNYKENELKKKELFEAEKRRSMEEALRANRNRQDKESNETIQFENSTIPTNLFGTQSDQVLNKKENQ